MKLAGRADAGAAPIGSRLGDVRGGTTAQPARIGSKAAFPWHSMSQRILR